MPSSRRLTRLVRIVTLPETRRLLGAAARSAAIRDVARRAVWDRAALLEQLRHPGDPRAAVRRAATHPATQELVDVGLVLLPWRYTPLRWVATWAAGRAIRRYRGRPGPPGDPE